MLQTVLEAGYDPHLFKSAERPLYASVEVWWESNPISANQCYYCVNHAMHSVDINIILVYA